ncbi:CpaE family protein [Nocardioides sp.]|uniref:AAA family ATPase n=1 Tax=Nocardioides sp. TaxID=35761 RepID=UPI0035270562
MPVVIDTDSSVVAKLVTALPAGAHGVESVDRLGPWLDNRPEEYLVVLGPSVPLDEALSVCEDLRFSRPTVSVVLVRSLVDTDVLTRAMHAGARDVVADNDADALGAAAGRAHQLFTALRGPGGVAHMGRVVSVFSPKGGVGKTTMAVNLALTLSDRGARQVCLIDLDLAFGDVAITMQLFPSHSIEHAIGSEDSLDYEAIDGLLTRHESGLMVLAAPSLPDAHDRVTPSLVSRMIRVLKEKYDYVIVDTAPAFDEQTLTALDETDDLVMVATLDVPTLKNVKVALETLDMLNIAQDHRHLLLNRADDAVGIGAEKVEAILGMPVTNQISTSIDIAAATNAGRPIVLSAPDHASSRAVRALASTLSGGDAADSDDMSDDSNNRRRRKRR